MRVSVLVTLLACTCGKTYEPRSLHLCQKHKSLCKDQCVSFNLYRCVDNCVSLYLCHSATFSFDSLVACQCVGNTLGLHLWKGVSPCIDQRLSYNFVQCVDNVLAYTPATLLTFCFYWCFGVHHRLVCLQLSRPLPLLAS